MIVRIKYPKDITLKIKSNDLYLTAINSQLNEECIEDEYVIDNCNSFDIIVTSDIKPLNVTLFRKNWIDGIKWSFISVDWRLKNQSWKVDFETLGKNKNLIEFNIKSDYTENYYNGYVKKYSLSIQNQKNTKIDIRNTTHIKIIEVFFMYLFGFLNQIPLLLFIVVFIYVDLVHPDWYKSGLFSIIIYDIPLSILLIINMSIATLKTKKIISWVKNKY